MKTETERKVTAIIDMYDELDQRKYVGDYSAVVYLDEFDKAVENANLTEMQLEVVNKFKVGFSATDISETLNISKQSVANIKHRLITKIAKQYRNGESL